MLPVTPIRNLLAALLLAASAAHAAPAGHEPDHRSRADGLPPEIAAERLARQIIGR